MSLPVSAASSSVRFRPRGLGPDRLLPLAVVVPTTAPTSAHRRPIVRFSTAGIMVGGSATCRLFRRVLPSRPMFPEHGDPRCLMSDLRVGPGWRFR